MNTSEWIEPFRNYIVVRNAEPQDTERIEEFFRRELAKGGHRPILIPSEYKPKHRADTDDSLLAMIVPGKHKAEDWSQMFRLGQVVKDFAKKTGKPVLLESKVKNSRDLEGPS